MKCCIDCFSDIEIRSIIESKQTKGDCEFCGCSNTFVYELSEDPSISQLFDGLLDVYTPVSVFPTAIPKNDVKLLRDFLVDDWSIFSVSRNVVQQLLENICQERYQEEPALFMGPVGILESSDNQYLMKNSLLKTYGWDEFVKELKENNRFHTDYINREILKLFLSCVKVTHRRGETFYRARFCTDQAGIKPEDMGPPPAKLASAGRANSRGISRLYLSDKTDTTLYEIRAGVYDYVTVGEFILKRDIEVIDLAQIDKISPFVANSMTDIDLTMHAINLDALRKIAKEIAKPLRRHDSQLDYLPTQYISDFIKSLGSDGIQFNSTMSQDGYNLTLFDAKISECKNIKVYDIKKIHYGFEQIAI